MSRSLLGLLLVLTACGPVKPAKEAADLQAGVLELPFELRANKITLPVRVCGSRPLNLILDTGMAFDGVLVYNPNLADSIGLPAAIPVEVPGAGSGPPSMALMTDSGSFSCGGWARAGQRVIVLQDPTMRGFASDGVIGYSLFGYYAVEADHDSMVVRLHAPGRAPVDST